MSQNKIKVYRIFNDSQDNEGRIYTYGVVFSYGRMYFTCILDADKVFFWSLKEGVIVNNLSIIIDAHLVKVDNNYIYIKTNYDVCEHGGETIYQGVFFESLDKYHFSTKQSITDGSLIIEKIKITKKDTLNLKEDVPYKVIITSKKMRNIESSMMVFIKSINGKTYKQEPVNISKIKTKKWYKFW